MSFLVFLIASVIFSIKISAFVSKMTKIFVIFLVRFVKTLLYVGQVNAFKKNSMVFGAS